MQSLCWYSKLLPAYKACDSFQNLCYTELVLGHKVCASIQSLCKHKKLIQEYKASQGINNLYCALAWSAIAEEHLAQRFIYVCVLCVTCVALGVEPRMTICADERSQFLLFVYLHPETQFLDAFNDNESV